MVIESNGSDEYKCAAILEYLESEIAGLWLYCIHLSVILELFSPIGLAPRSNFGSYRVELVVMLFNRIVDLHNFEFVMMVLNAEEQAALYARIGKRMPPITFSFKPDIYLLCPFRRLFKSI